ncbi:MAG: hypothetical protein PHU01_12360, partial [Desulfuromonadaceae bacterium]|nr:hypothetical protein [Desulfuromonadaceae bacterium]
NLTFSAISSVAVRVPGANGCDDNLAAATQPASVSRCHNASSYFFMYGFVVQRFGRTPAVSGQCFFLVGNLVWITFWY